MSETSLEHAGVLMDAIRTAFSFFDRGPYLLLKYVYQLFFNVASADVLTGATIMNFFSRVQLIIGVFMMFQLAMSILKGIMNPDSFSDGKTGFGNIITRIVTSLVLLTLLVPINIPSPRNEYEKQINNNGLLFGTLYSLQNRILSNNTLGRLILGVNDEGHNYTSWDSDDEELEYASNVFTSTILKMFYRINLVPEDERVHEDGKEDYMINDNRICQDIDDDVLEEYSRIDADPQTIISMVTKSCNVGDWWENLPVVDFFTDNEMYMLAYTGILPAIAAIVFIFVLLSFTIDVAVRAVKLAVLRLIAPIPIISYMDPKGGKDGAFNAWVKTLTSTYLDLFIRLGIIYFVLFLIESMMVNGIVIKHGTGVLGGFSKLAIWIGLIIFAKEAPKFMRQALGLKDSGFRLFGGITEALGVGAMGAGIIGSAATNYRASNEEQKAIHPDRSAFGRHAMNVGSAIAGAIGGGYAGLNAWGKKDATASSVIAAQQKRNEMRTSHSTLPGRVADNVYGMFTGRGLAAVGNNKLKAAQDWVKAQGDFKSSLENEAKLNGIATNLGRLANGAAINARYSELERAVSSAHDGKVTINGTDYDANLFTQDFMEDALKAQVRSYQRGQFKTGGTSYAASISAGGKLYLKHEDVARTYRDVDVHGLDVQIVQNFNNYDIDNVDTYGKAIGAANNVISNQQNDMRQRMRNANSSQTGNKK